MLEPIISAHIQKPDCLWFCQMLSQTAFPYHNIPVTFDTDKIRHILAAGISLQGNITSDLCNLFDSRQLHSISRLHRVKSFAYAAELWQGLFFASSFVSFSSHGNLPKISQIFPKNFPKIFLQNTPDILGKKKSQNQDTFANLQNFFLSQKRSFPKMICPRAKRDILPRAKMCSVKGREKSPKNPVQNPPKNL